VCFDADIYPGKGVGLEYLDSGVPNANKGEQAADDGSQLFQMSFGDDDGVLVVIYQLLHGTRRLDLRV
jgi:hypothetical protein